MERPELTEAEWAWIAGILEGEGSFGLVNGRIPRVQVGMTDFDVIERIVALLGVGTLSVFVPKEGATAKKPALRLDIRKARDVVWVMEQVLPWMGKRRSAKIRSVLRQWEESPTQLGPADRTHCPAGHEYTEENTYRTRATDRHPSGGRKCRVCIEISNQRHNDARVRVDPNRMECSNGHELTEENTFIVRGTRQCRRCRTGRPRLVVA